MKFFDVFFPWASFCSLQFPAEHFTIILFHYDNSVNEWSQFDWNDRVIHIQHTGQSKWYDYVPLHMCKHLMIARLASCEDPLYCS
jgi:hypothetical protein